MGIQNKNLDPSQQRLTLDIALGAIATGVTTILGTVPYYASLDAVRLMATSISGSPTGALYVQRFIPGTGFTSFILGSTFAMPALGTSGVLNITSGVSLPQIGSTLTLLFPNDVFLYVSGGANSAVGGLAGGLVLRPVASAVNYYGLI